ncbi:IDEAL domain-containing protein [Bacillus smithii]|uniref:IDEAL domain-containing protein n=1 Tax=Bacillus smithii TaxID=1479 RepID=UPI003D1979A4
MASNFRLEIGDWVKGKTRNGELLQGYIDMTDPLRGVVKVTVVKSDNEKLVGKTIGMLEKNVEKLALSDTMSEEEILYLIDLALLTKDEDWFMELSAKLSTLKSDNQKSNMKNSVCPKDRNGLKRTDSRG